MLLIDLAIVFLAIIYSVYSVYVFINRYNAIKIQNILTASLSVLYVLRITVTKEAITNEIQWFAFWFIITIFGILFQKNVDFE